MSSTLNQREDGQIDKNLASNHAGPTEQQSDALLLPKRPQLSAKKHLQHSVNRRKASQFPLELENSAGEAPVYDNENSHQLVSFRSKILKNIQKSAMQLSTTGGLPNPETSEDLIMAQGNPSFGGVQLLPEDITQNVEDVVSDGTYMKSYSLIQNQGSRLKKRLTKRQDIIGQGPNENSSFSRGDNFTSPASRKFLSHVSGPQHAFGQGMGTNATPIGQNFSSQFGVPYGQQAQGFSAQSPFILQGGQIGSQNGIFQSQPQLIQTMINDQSANFQTPRSNKQAQNQTVGLGGQNIMAFTDDRMEEQERAELERDDIKMDLNSQTQTPPSSRFVSPAIGGSIARRNEPRLVQNSPQKTSLVFKEAGQFERSLRQLKNPEQNVNLTSYRNVINKDVPTLKAPTSAFVEYSNKSKKQGQPQSHEKQTAIPQTKQVAVNRLNKLEQTKEGLTSGRDKIPLRHQLEAISYGPVYKGQMSLHQDLEESSGVQATNSNQVANTKMQLDVIAKKAMSEKAEVSGAVKHHLGGQIENRQSSGFSQRAEFTTTHHGTNIFQEDTGGENTTNGANKLSQHFFKRQTNSSLTQKEEDNMMMPTSRPQEVNTEFNLQNSNDQRSSPQNLYPQSDKRPSAQVASQQREAKLAPRGQRREMGDEFETPQQVHPSRPRQTQASMQCLNPYVQKRHNGNNCQSQFQRESSRKGVVSRRRLVDANTSFNNSPHVMQSAQRLNRSMDMGSRYQGKGVRDNSPKHDYEHEHVGPEDKVNSGQVKKLQMFGSQQSFYQQSIKESGSPQQYHHQNQQFVHPFQPVTLQQSQPQFQVNPFSIHPLHQRQTPLPNPFMNPADSHQSVTPHFHQVAQHPGQPNASQYPPPMYRGHHHPMAQHQMMMEHYPGQPFQPPYQHPAAAFHRGGPPPSNPDSQAHQHMHYPQGGFYPPQHFHPMGYMPPQWHGVPPQMLPQHMDHSKSCACPSHHPPMRHSSPDDQQPYEQDEQDRDASQHQFEDQPDGQHYADQNDEDQMQGELRSYPQTSVQGGNPHHQIGVHPMAPHPYMHPRHPQFAGHPHAEHMMQAPHQMHNPFYAGNPQAMYGQHGPQHFYGGHHMPHFYHPNNFPQQPGAQTRQSSNQSVFEQQDIQHIKNSQGFVEPKKRIKIESKEQAQHRVDEEQKPTNGPDEDDEEEQLYAQKPLINENSHSISQSHSQGVWSSHNYTSNKRDTKFNEKYAQRMNRALQEENAAQSPSRYSRIIDGSAQKFAQNLSPKAYTHKEVLTTKFNLDRNAEEQVHETPGKNDGEGKGVTQLEKDKQAGVFAAAGHKRTYSQMQSYNNIQTQEQDLGKAQQSSQYGSKIASPNYSRSQHRYCKDPEDLDRLHHHFKDLSNKECKVDGTQFGGSKDAKSGPSFGMPSDPRQNETHKVAQQWPDQDAKPRRDLPPTLDQAPLTDVSKGGVKSSGQFKGMSSESTPGYQKKQPQEIAQIQVQQVDQSFLQHQGGVHSSFPGLVNKPSTIQAPALPRQDSFAAMHDGSSTARQTGKPLSMVHDGRSPGSQTGKHGADGSNRHSVQQAIKALQMGKGGMADERPPHYYDGEHPAAAQKERGSSARSAQSRKSATPTLKAFMEAHQPHMLVKDYQPDKAAPNRAASPQKQDAALKQPTQGGATSVGLQSQESGSQSVRMPMMFNVINQEATFSGQQSGTHLDLARSQAKPKQPQAQISQNSNEYNFSTDKQGLPVVPIINSVKNNPSSVHDSSSPAPSFKPCNCKKTGCFKLYCDCLRAGQLCSDLCKCTGCKNRVPHEERDKLLAFHRAKMDYSSPYKQAINFNGQMSPSRGCGCKKSGCQKNYCECFQLGIPCSTHCGCGKNCKNQHPQSDNSNFDQNSVKRQFMRREDSFASKNSSMGKNSSPFHTPTKRMPMGSGAGMGLDSDMDNFMINPIQVQNKVVPEQNINGHPFNKESLNQNVAVKLENIVPQNSASQPDIQIFQKNPEDLQKKEELSGEMQNSGQQPSATTKTSGSSKTTKKGASKQQTGVSPDRNNNTKAKAPAAKKKPGPKPVQKQKK